MRSDLLDTDTSAVVDSVLKLEEATSNIVKEFFEATNMPVLPLPEDIFSDRQGESIGSEDTIIPNDFVKSNKESRMNTRAPLHSGEIRDVFQIIQKWEGIVTETCDDSFFAELTALKGENTDLIVEIYNAEVDEDDLELLEPGAMFYWCIGYIKKPSGTIRASLIRFRRLPPWTKRQMQKAKAKSLKYNSLVNAN